jgi:O-antigen ligase
MKYRTEKNISRLDNLIIISLCVLIFGLPFSKSVIEIAATAAISLWLFKKVVMLRSIRVAHTPLNTPLSVYFLFCALSIVNSRHLATSLTGFGFKAMEHFLIFAVMVDTIRTQKALRVVIWAVLSSCALIGADGLWQYFTRYDFLRHYPIWSSFNRVTASFEFPNGLAGWLITVIPLCVSLAIFDIKEKALRISAALLSALLLWCLVLNFTKGALAAILPALVFIAWIRGENAKKALLTVLLLLLLGIGLAAAFGGYKVLSSYAAAGWSAMHRVDLMKMCWKMFLDRPFLGHGLNTFMSIFEAYSAGLRFGGISYAHNCYMQILAETGIFGLLSFLWMIAVLFVSSAKSIAAKNDGLLKAGQIGVSAGLLAYLAHSAVETNLYALQLAVLFYYFLGLSAGMQNLGGER